MYLGKKTTFLFVTLFACIWTIQLGWAQDLQGPEKADMNWQAFKGSGITVVFGEHPWSPVAKSLVPEFERLTGIKVNVVMLSEDEMTRKRDIDMATGVGQYDTAFMGDYVVVYEKRGWLVPLKEYFSEEGLIDMNWYDLGDVDQAGITFYTPPGGEWSAIPITCGPQVYMYRKDLFKQAGLDVPYGFAQVYDIAEKLYNPPELYGITLSAKRAPDHSVWEWAPIFRAFGGEYVTDGKVNINSAAGVLALQWESEILQKYASPGVSSYDWYASLSEFQAGKSGQWWDGTDFASSLENPEESLVSGKVGYARMPAGPFNRRVSNPWYWGLGVSSLSKNKEGTALFIAWITSKSVQLGIAPKASNASRYSVWENKKFQDEGGLPRDFFTATAATLKEDVDVGCYVWTPDWAEWDTYLAVAISSAVAGEMDPEDALNEAARQATQVRIKLGLE